MKACVGLMALRHCMSVVQQLSQDVLWLLGTILLVPGHATSAAGQPKGGAYGEVCLCELQVLPAAVLLLG